MRTEDDRTARSAKSQQLVQPIAQLPLGCFSPGPLVEPVGTYRSLAPDEIELTLFEMVETPEVVHLVANRPSLQAIEREEKRIPFNKFDPVRSPFMTDVQRISKGRADIEEINGLQLK